MNKREILMDRNSNFVQLPGHGPNIDEMTDHELQKRVVLIESMFELAWIEDRAKDLAEKIVHHIQPSRSIFKLGSLVLINASYSEEGSRLQEYSVGKWHEETMTYYMFESLTVSWYTTEELAKDLLKFHRQSIDKMESVWGEQPLILDPAIEQMSYELIKQIESINN